MFALVLFRLKKSYDELVNRNQELEAKLLEMVSQNTQTLKENVVFSSESGDLRNESCTLISRKL